MAGRTGRGRPGRGFYSREPKYLSIQPRVLRFSPPDLTNNGFYILGKEVLCGKSDFIGSAKQVLPYNDSNNPTPNDTKFNYKTGKPTVNGASTEMSVKRMLKFNTLTLTSDESDISSDSCSTNNHCGTKHKVQTSSVSKSNSQHEQKLPGSDLEKFYARRKVFKSKKNKKNKDTLQTSHSSRATTMNKYLKTSLLDTMNSPSQRLDATLPPAIKQSFLHSFVRKTLPLAKLTPLTESHEMDLDAIDLPVPPENEVITLYPDLISFIKSKLRTFYVHSGLSEKLDSLHTLDMDQILVEAYRANTQLCSESMLPQSQTTMDGSTSMNAPDSLNDPPDNETMQSFLHEYLRFIAPVSKIRLSQGESDMEVDETPFEVPPNDAKIVLYDSLVRHMRKKLKIYYQVYDDKEKVTNVDAMNLGEVANLIFAANTMLLKKTNNGNQDMDNNMQDADSEPGNPLSTQASSDNQRTSTQDRSTASMNFSGLDKNTSTNVGLFTSKVQDAPAQTLTQNPDPGTTQDARRHTKALEKTTITCRFRIRLQQNMCHVPHIARQVANLVKKADAAMTILPFNTNDSANAVLDSPDLLPNDEEAIKTWVTNAYTYRDNINFSMRFSVLKTFKFITNALFPWMSKNNSFVKMDKIKAEKIVTVGFFTKFHPEFHNRDDFKSFCKKHVQDMTENNLQDDISVYPRSVYAGIGINKITSRVCVLECAVDDAPAITEAFAGTLPDPYEKLTFVPFTKVDESYTGMLRAALIEQNQFLNSMRRLVIHGLTNISTSIVTKEQQVLTPQKWILQVKYEDVPIITAVERNSTSATNIIYDVCHEAQVQELFSSFSSALKTNFEENVIVNFFSEVEKPVQIRSRAVSMREKNYLEVLKRRYGNPQDGLTTHITPPPQRRKTMTYGEAMRTPTMSAHPDFEEVNTSQSVEARLKALEDKMKNPSTDSESLSQDSMTTTSVQALIQTSVESMGNTLRGEMTQMIENNNAKLANELMTEFQKMIMATLRPGSTSTTVTQKGAGKN